MSIDKVFEALEEIGNIDLGNNPYKKFDTNKLKNVYGVEFTTLYNALTELKAIKEAKPSEAMEDLDNIIRGFNETTTGMYGLGEVVVGNELEHYYKNELTSINKALLKAQDLEKVLNDIIKHLSFEGSGVEVVKDFINDKEETKYIIKVTSKDTGATIHIRLDTEEESELLKRYFDNENNK